MARIERNLWLSTILGALLALALVLGGVWALSPDNTRAEPSPTLLLALQLDAQYLADRAEYLAELRPNCAHTPCEQPESVPENALVIQMRCIKALDMLDELAAYRSRIDPDARRSLAAFCRSDVSGIAISSEAEWRALAMLRATALREAANALLATNN